MDIKLEKYKQRVEDFIKDNNREPRATDYNRDPNLPSTRFIQRYLGGLKKFRLDIGLQTIDFSKGRERSAAAKKAVNKSLEYEKYIYDKMFKVHHKFDSSVVVDRQFPYQVFGDNPGKNEKRADIGITYRKKRHIIFIDLFYPSNTDSLGGCIRIKRKKLRDNPVQVKDYTYEIYFVCMNPKFKQKEIDGLSIQTDNYPILSIETFNKKFMLE
jgi:hypothetical protein